MNWHPSSEFRYDLGYVGPDDFNTKISELPHYDLTHLIMWTQALKRLKSYVDTHSDQIFEDNKIDTALYSNVFIAIAMGFAMPSIKARFKSDLEASLQPAMDALHLTTANYVTNRGGKVDATLHAEKEARFASGDILRDDITEGTVAAVRQAHPDVDYAARARYILTTLEPVKDTLHDDYAYWQNVLKWVS